LWRIALACLAAATLQSGSAWAQETTGTITGVVTDQTGAILPGATVLVKQLQTGRTTEVVTNETGRYTASLLQPGTYEVTFNLSGFQPAVVRGIELHVNDRLEVNGKLGVGVTETVDVAASSQFIQPTPAVQNLMGARQVQELPLNNRNFVQLATLVPGVSSDLSDEVGVGLASTVSISVNGARRNAVNWLVDGVSNVDVGSNITLLSTPTLESIQEFKIITSSYAAEWPRSGGGIVNVVTKSGTNQFSGSAYEFYRDDKLNANSFTRNLSTNAETAGNPPALDYNNFGYTIGGPILPWRDKAFFFFSQEWRRITRAPASTTANVVDPAWLNDPSNPNFVPPEQRDPNAVRLLEAWPAGNLGADRHLVNAPNINNTRQEVIRLDYDLNPSWRLTGRYTHDLSETREFGGLFFNAVVPNVATTNTDVPGQVAAVQLRTVIGADRLNEFSYQMSGNKISTTTPDGTRNTRSDFGLAIPELFPENAANRMPVIAFTGGLLSTVGAHQFINIEYVNHTLTDNFSWAVGRHNFKGGLLLAFEQKNENATNETHGRFTFGAGGGRTAFQNFLLGNADGLCGSACTYAEAEIDVTNHLRFNRYEMYVQDTWRPGSQLTVDYGLRYSLFPPVTDRDNLLTSFSPSAYDPALAPQFANATGSLIDLTTGSLTNGIIIAGVNSPFGDAIYKYDKGNLQPRIGMTYDLRGDSRTLLRSAYGIYYDQPLVGIFEQNAFTNPPFVNTVSIQNARLSNPAAGTTTTTAGVRNLIATGEDFETPRMQQWNVGIQHQLYANGVIDVSYVGSRGDNLIRPIDINYPQPIDVVNLGSANLARPFQGYGSITMRETTAKSRYHGLLTSFRHVYSRGGEFTLNYTLSRNRTDASNDRDAVDIPQNPLDLAAEYADARTDRRHVFSGHFVYDLPFFNGADENAALKATLGGWQIAGIVNIASGPPIPRIQVDTNGFRRGNRADQVGDPRAGELDYPLWFDPNAFVPPADGTFGNSPRAAFRQPGRHQWDLTFSKNWRPTGDVRLQFRAELINAFNHTQWLGDSVANGLDNTCTASVTTCLAANDRFGQIIAVRAPREIQLGFKVYW
jgi:hypothetical protein